MVPVVSAFAKVTTPSLTLILLSFPIQSAKHGALALHVILHGFRTMLLAEARSLDAAEGQLVVAIVNLVHPGDPGVDLAECAVGPADVLSPDRRPETPQAAIGLRDRFIERLHLP